MRIVSQDGCADLPYEQTWIKRIGGDIYAMSMDFKDPIVLARYNREYDAMNAMKKCRENYIDLKYNQAFKIPGGNVFQFPED